MFIFCFCRLYIYSKCGETPAARCSYGQGWFFRLTLIYLWKKKNQINNKKRLLEIYSCKGGKWDGVAME